MFIRFGIILMMALCFNFAFAAEGDGFSVMAGLWQPLVFKGANAAIQYKTEKWVFEYSHGWNLNLNEFSSAMTTDEVNSGAKIVLPWSTGGGLGYRLTKKLHFLVEVKAHKYLVSMPGGTSANYFTYSVGPGIFYDTFLGKHLFFETSLRWWPTVSSTLDTNGTTLTKSDGSIYVHRSHTDLGKDNYIFNVSIGYNF